MGLSMHGCGRWAVHGHSIGRSGPDVSGNSKLSQGVVIIVAMTNQLTLIECGETEQAHAVDAEISQIPVDSRSDTSVDASVIDGSAVDAVDDGAAPRLTSVAVPTPSRAEAPIDWAIDEQTKRIGRAGLQGARAALEEARVAMTSAGDADEALRTAA